MDKPPQCAVCGTTQQLLRCAKCKSIFYCSPSHQHSHWGSHKPICRQLAKQKNNNRMQQLQQAVAGTTLSNDVPTTSVMCRATTSSSSVGGYNRWPTTNGVTDIGFGLLGGTDSAEVDPSILTAVPPLSVMLGADENVAMNNQAAGAVKQLNDAGFPQVYQEEMEVSSTTIDAQMPYNNCGAAAASNGAATAGDCSLNAIHNGAALAMPHHFHNVDQRLLTHYSQQQVHYNNTNQYGIQQEQQQQQHQQQQQQQQQQTHQQQQISTTSSTYAPQTTSSMTPPHINSHSTQQQYEKSFSYQIGSGGGVDEKAFGNANERRYDELCRNIINDMNQYGLSVVDDFLGVEKGLQILSEVHRMYSAGVFKDGQLVNNIKEEELHTIRGDKITWVKGVEPGCANVGYLINQIDAVICRANTMKNNGQLGNYNIKERTKAMVACYPGSGSHYVVHVDNPNKDGRVITAIYYLNVNWDTKRSGGVLRIFPEHGNSVADIEPKFDRLIFFWSDKRNPHEVQPSHRTRYAITVWYFDANEREAALKRCNNINKNNAKATITTTSTNTSKIFANNINENTNTKMAATTTATPGQHICSNTNINAKTNINNKIINTDLHSGNANTNISSGANNISHTNANANTKNTNMNVNTSSSSNTIANSSEICT